MLLRPWLAAVLCNLGALLSHSASSTFSRVHVSGRRSRCPDRRGARYRQALRGALLGGVRGGRSHFRRPSSGLGFVLSGWVVRPCFQLFELSCVLLGIVAMLWCVVPLFVLTFSKLPCWLCCLDGCSSSRLRRVVQTASLFRERILASTVPRRCSFDEDDQRRGPSLGVGLCISVVVALSC